MFDAKDLTSEQQSLVAAMKTPGLVETARRIALEMGVGMRSADGAPSMAVAMAAVSVACIAVEHTGMREQWEDEKTYRLIVDLVVAMIHVKKTGAETRAREALAPELASIFKKEAPRG